MINFQSTFIIILTLFNFLLSNNYIDLKKNITSLLDTQSINSFQGNILVSTSGGLYNYTNHSSNILNESNISFLEVNNDNLFVGSSYPGKIFVFDNNFNTISYINYPEFDEILDISFSQEYFFATGILNQNNILIKYISNEFNELEYVNYFDSFPLLFESINDLHIYNDSIYLATSNGLINSNYQNSFLSLSDSWSIDFINVDISSIIEFQNSLYLCYENKVVDINNNEIVTFPNEEIIKSLQIISNQLLIITNLGVYNYSFANNIVQSHTLPEGYGGSVNSYLKLDDISYYGISNKGFLIKDLNNDWKSYVPNTIYKNQFDALTLLHDGSLFGVVNNRNDAGQSGGFIYKNPLLNDGGLSINNFYSYNSYNINNYPLSSGDFKANVMDYWSGDNTVHSVASFENKIIFSNSGIYPKSWLGYYSQVADDYLFSLSDDTFYGGLIEFRYNSIDNSLDLNNYYSLENNVLGGNNGIFNSSWDNGFMTINQIKYDDFGNLWVANPYSELNNNTIAVNNNNNWYHIQDNNDGYIPKEIHLDKNNNLWISYLFSETMNNSIPYSPGGIRMIEFNDITSPSDDIWHINWLDELENLNIWSLVISMDNYGNEILWVMTDYGIMGYIINVSYTYSSNIIVDFTKIQDEYYFQGLNYDEGCKLRLDNNNNIWITTKSNGLRIIKNNGENFSPDLSQITKDSHNILSDIIYDVIFDNYGNAYIATELGISILETSFNQKSNDVSIGVSPNPFLIGEHSELIISNVSNDAILKIINLNGYILKTFNMKNYNRTISWDGRSDNGKKIPTGVYLLTSYDKNFGSKTTKIALINK